MIEAFTGQDFKRDRDVGGFWAGIEMGQEDLPH